MIRSLLKSSTFFLFMLSTLCFGEDETKPIVPEDTQQEKIVEAVSNSLQKSPLGQALIGAYRNNTEIQDQRAALRVSDLGIPRALAGYKPKLTADAGLMCQKDVLSGDVASGKRMDVTNSSPLIGTRDKSADVGVVLAQNIYRGGSDAAATKGAEGTVRAQRAQLLAVEQKILLSAVQAYLDLFAKMGQLDFLRANEKTLKETWDIAQEKFEVGAETRTSAAQAEAQWAEAVAKRQTAEAELEGIKATYERVTGFKPGNIERPADFTMVPKELKNAVEKAREQNPQVIAAIYQGVAARHKIDQIGGALLPTVDLELSLRRTLSKANQRYNENIVSEANAFVSRNINKTTQSVGIRASIPIYEAGATRAEQRKAHEESEQLRIAIETTRRQVVEQLVQAWENFLAAKNNILEYRKQVTALTVSLEGTRQEMFVGTKILLNVLNEQAKLLQAQLNLVTAEQSYYLSGYQILAAIGVLTARSLGLKIDGGYYNPEVHYQDVKNSF